jgi:hypothetical protein
MFLAVESAYRAQSPRFGMDVHIFMFIFFYMVGDLTAKTLAESVSTLAHKDAF